MVVRAVSYTYKKPPEIIGRHNFALKLLSSVELLSELALLSCSLVLVHKTLSASLVNLLDSELYSLGRLLSVSSLDNSLKVGLYHLVLKCLSCDNLYSLLSGLNIRHNHYLQKIVRSIFNISDRV